MGHSLLVESTGNSVRRSGSHHTSHSIRNLAISVPLRGVCRHRGALLETTQEEAAAKLDAVFRDAVHKARRQTSPAEGRAMALYRKGGYG